MLSNLSIDGFRAFRQVSIDLGPINVLIGPNGAGKSSIVDFFDMLGYLVTGRLQGWVRQNGSSTALLHFGPKHTAEVKFALALQTEKGGNRYGATLVHTRDERLVFSREWVEWSRDGTPATRLVEIGEPWHLESALDESVVSGDKTAESVRWHLHRYKVFHFHDTSPSSKMRASCSVSDGRYLRGDGSNLAAVLARLQRERRRHYDRILTMLRRVVPFLNEFVFPDPAEESSTVNLSWRHQNQPVDYVFGPQHLSDGSLRTIALLTLLLLPEDERPHLVVLDEPELGLHPAAISLLGALVRAASQQTQFVLATQSTMLLDQFEPNEVLIVESRDGASTFRRPDANAMEQWRHDFDYSLSDQWDMNLVGGRP